MAKRKLYDSTTKILSPSNFPISIASIYFDSLSK